jgi:phospholipase C
VKRSLAMTILLALILLLPSPAAAFPQEMHPALGYYAIMTLRSDGKEAYAGMFDCQTPGQVTLADRLMSGELDADRVDLSRNHYYDPATGQGLAGCQDAVSLSQQFYDLAVLRWRSGDFDGGIYMLGRAVHLVQDVCMPHHVHLEVFNGHAEFEDWLAGDTNHSVISRGIYDLGSIADYGRANAAAVYGLYPLVISANASEANYVTVAAVIEPLAIRSTAGVLDLFCHDVRDSSPELYAAESERTHAKLVWSPCPDGDFVRYELYLSEPGKKIVLDEAHLFIKIADRTVNHVSLNRLDSQGTYQFQLVTVHSDHGNVSNILQLQAGYTGWLLIALTGAFGALIVAAFVTSERSRRRK